MRDLVKSGIVLGSEALWIYYVVALFTSLEWGQATFIDPTWWFIAAFTGLFLNYFCINRLHYIFLASMNVILLAIIIVRNWLLTVPDGALFFGIFVSFSLLFLFARAISLLLNLPTRMQILYRFEGNVIFYALLLVAFTVKGWTNNTFHLVFISAIFISLLGVSLTLNEREISENDKEVDVHKVSSAGPFSIILYILFFLILAVSASLFLPAVRSSLQAIAHIGLAGLTSFFKQVHKLFSLLIELLPKRENVGEIPPLERGDTIQPTEVEEGITETIPIEWFFLGIGIVVAIVLILVLFRVLKHWKTPVYRPTSKKEKVRRNTFFLLWEKLRTYLRLLRKKWRCKLPRFYKKRIYWEVARIERWGKRHGMIRLPHESVPQYIDKIIRYLESYRDAQTGKEKEIKTYEDKKEKEKKLIKDLLVKDSRKIKSEEKEHVEEVMTAQRHYVEDNGGKWIDLVNELKSLGNDFEAVYYGKTDVTLPPTYRTVVNRLNKRIKEINPK